MGDEAHVESGVGSNTICVEVPEDGFKGARGGKVGKEAWVLPVHQTFFYFLFFIFPRECLSVRVWIARNEVVVRMRTGDDELVVVLRDVLKGLANLWCRRCGNCREIEAQRDMRYRRRRTRESSSEISRFYL